MKVGYEYIMEDVEDGTLTYTISIDRPSDEDITVHYETRDEGAFAGSDYTAVSGEITIPAGQTSVDIEVPITNDADQELLEYFYMDISKPDGADNYNIVDPQSSAKIFSDDLEARTLNIDSSQITDDSKYVIFDIDLDKGYDSAAVLEFNIDTNIDGLIDENGHATDMSSSGKSQLFQYSLDSGETWKNMRFDAEYFEDIDNFIWLPKDIDSFIVRADIQGVDLPENPTMTLDIFSDFAIQDNRTQEHKDANPN